MGDSYEEGDLKAAIAAGERVLGVFVVARRTPRGCGYILYIRASGLSRSYLPLRTWRHRTDRVWRSLDRLVAMVRHDLRYEGEIGLFVAGDPELQRFSGILPIDRDQGPRERL